MGHDEGFGGALATSHIGRRVLLDQIVSEALASEVGARMIFLCADGGYGKSRMLQAVLKQIPFMDPDALCARDLVDLYHVEHHTPLGLLDALYNVLTPPTEPLRRSRSEYDKLTRMRLSGHAIGVKEQQEEVVSRFRADLQEVTKTKRIVVALDTAERVLYQNMLGGAEQRGVRQFADAWKWILEELPQWGNVTILVAGRPVIKSLEDDAKEHNRFKVTTHALSPFDFDETSAYLDAVRIIAEQSEQKSLKRVAELISTMDADYRRVLFAASGGRPILVALCLDLATVTGTLPFSREQLEPDLNLPLPSREMEEAIIRRIMEKGGEQGRTVVAVGRLPKGATPELLGKVLDCSLPEAKTYLNAIRQLSFVKLRPADERVFLHDEMYAMLRRYVYDTAFDAIEAKIAYVATVDYYDEQIKFNREKIDEAFADVDAAKTNILDLVMLGGLYNVRRNLMTEVVYYHLALSPPRGFMRYYRYMREATYASDTLLSTQLVLTLHEWWRDRDPDDSKEVLGGLPRDLISDITLVRPVVRAFAEGRYADTILEAEKVRVHMATVGQGQPWISTATIVDFWDAYARIYLGGGDNTAKAISLLDAGIANIKMHLGQTIFQDSDIGEDAKAETWPSTIAILKWRAVAVLALGYRLRGYCHRVANEHHDAIEDYKRAATLWRQIHMKVELAYTLNDLGYVYGLLNYIDDAIDIVNSALVTRRDIGFRVHVALSLNTLGLIELADGRFQEAELHTTQALAIFRALDNIRGIGLALLALGETLRRDNARNESPRTIDARIDRLRLALEYDNEAIDIFRDSSEALRLVEAYIEAGCCLRDWVSIRRKSPDSRENLRRYLEQGREYLEKAAAIAKERKLEYRLLDAMVDLAWLEYVDKPQDTNAIEKAIESAYQIVPSDYYLDKTKGIAIIPRSRADKIRWTRIAKLCILQGHMVFDQYLARSENDYRIRLEEDGGTMLKAIAEYYLLTLEYNALYALDYRDSRRTTTQIGIRLERLRSDELRIISSSVSELEKEWGLDKQGAIDAEGPGSHFRKLLVRRTLWQE